MGRNLRNANRLKSQPNSRTKPHNRLLDKPVKAQKGKKSRVEVDDHIVGGKILRSATVESVELNAHEHSLPTETLLSMDESHEDKSKDECLVNKKSKVRKHLLESELERTLRLKRAKLKRHEEKYAILLKACPTISLPIYKQNKSIWKSSREIIDPWPPIQIKTEPVETQAAASNMTSVERQISPPKKKIVTWRFTDGTILKKPK